MRRNGGGYSGAMKRTRVVQIMKRKKERIMGIKSWLRMII